MTTKDTLLRALKEAPGTWVSGEELSQNLSVSRSAVWKQVGKLKEEGYVIDSSPKKGYALRESTGLMLPFEIRDGLETHLFGQKEIHHFVATDSTNRIARELAAQGAAEGSMVITEQQRKGRGRLGRLWFSPAGEGIYVSLILRPSISTGDAPRITLLTGVALADTLLTRTPLDVHVKWPNDILVGKRKLAGILTEINAEMDAIVYVVVGIGINVNTSHFPSEFKSKGTSIYIETGDRYSRLDLIKAFLKVFETRYEGFLREGFQPVVKRCRELCKIRGQKVQVEMAGQKTVGHVLDIDEEGRLVLQGTMGRVHRIYSGSVTLL
jgi:BirA family biotin operon repressor/biotin-[acetyl-CoA-carboxylase] ligase